MTSNDLSVSSRTSLLQDVCRQVKDAEALASTRLLAPIDGNSAKQKAYQTCKHCRQEYAVVENHTKACRYHAGAYESHCTAVYVLAIANASVGSRHVDLDLPIWADHDPSIHVDPEELILDGNDSMYLEGVIYECCNAPGHIAGCVRSRHKPVVAFGKRRRLS